MLCGPITPLPHALDLEVRNTDAQATQHQPAREHSAALCAMVLVVLPLLAPWMETLMKQLKLVDPNDDGVIVVLNISDRAFERLSGEYPILKHGQMRYTYRDAADNWIEYEPARQFTVNAVDPNEAVMFETDWPDNVL